MPYLARTIDAELNELLPLAPAIALDGPKGVGKTATAERRATASWFLDQPIDLARLVADPTFDGAPEGTLLIDEWQRFPQIWDVVRRSVDRGAAPGRFILTGSATPSLGSDTHSGAGRILSLRMRPLALYERGVVDPTVSLRSLLEGRPGRIQGSTAMNAAGYFASIEESGFPGIFSQPELLRVELLNSYVRRIIDRDLPDLGVSVRRPEVLRRWLASYAAASSTTMAYSRLLDATTAGEGAQPAKTTTVVYRDHLTQLWLLDPVPGWSPSRSPISRLQVAPKHQLADPALAARLLNLSARSLGSRSGAFMAGPLFESLATLSVRVAAQAARADVGHVRTRNGDHEVDLIVEARDGGVIGIEVKLAADIVDSDVRHLLWLREQIPNEVVDLVVISAGKHAYRRPDGVAVVPLALLGY